MLAATLSIPNPVDARKVRTNVVWAAPEAKPSDVELQGNDFGSKAFVRSADSYSLEHIFNLARPTRLIISYADVSVPFAMQPHGSADVVTFRLNVATNQYCDLNVVNRIEQKARSTDQNQVMSSAIQSALVLASNSCDSVLTRRLNAVQFSSRCQLTKLTDYFDIMAFGVAGFDQQIAACKRDLVRRLAENVNERFNGLLKAGKLSAAMEVYADIEAILGNEGFSTALAELPSEKNMLVAAKPQFLVTSYIVNQSIGNIEAARQNKTEIQANLDNDLFANSLKKFYREEQLEKILGDPAEHEALRPTGPADEVAAVDKTPDPSEAIEPVVSSGDDPVTAEPAPLAEPEA